MTAPLVDITGLCVDFDTPNGRRRVVNDISLMIEPGEVLGILGESGSGKTMTTLALLGLIDAYPGVTEGKIVVRDKRGLVDLLSLPSKALRQDSQNREKNSRLWQRNTHQVMRDYWGGFMTAIFQHPKASLDPLETVGQQVTESVALAHPGESSKEHKARALSWLSEVQLSDPMRVFSCYPHELSGGMCQRAMIAVAIAREPLLLIADEPTTGLDSTVRAEIVELFRSLLENRKRSMIYISHDIREVLYLADRVVVMRHGQIVETVAADDLHRGVGERHAYTKLLMTASEMAFAE